MTNHERTNFLDVTFDLSNDTYKPYRKPNDEPLYIHRSSNHPPSILRQLPISINNRINTLSSNKDIFENAAPTYNEALKKSNFPTQLSFEPKNTNANTTCNRKRNTIWFNPPYSKNVKTHIAHEFLNLIDKHFPPNSKLSKIFNRHTIRVSYSCGENIKTFITRHNKNILNRLNPQSTQNKTNLTKTCNCRQQHLCPTDGNCLNSNVIYKAEVTTTDNNETKTYIGVTACDFKTRYRNHIKSITNAKYRKETELSKHTWTLKENKRNYNIKWGFIKQLPPAHEKQKSCRLCLEERLLILKGRKKNILNKRSELFSACRHVT